MGRMPWERLEDEGETTARYQAFECFLYQQPRARNMQTAWTKYCEIRMQGNDTFGPARWHEGKYDPNKLSGRFRYWKKHYRWAERAEAWDDHSAQVRRKEQEKAIRSEAKNNAVEVHKFISDLADYAGDVWPELKTAFTKAISSEGATPAAVNQLMRTYMDMVRMLKDFDGGTEPRIPEVTQEQIDAMLAKAEPTKAELRAEPQEKRDGAEG